MEANSAESGLAESRIRAIIAAGSRSLVMKPPTTETSSSRTKMFEKASIQKKTAPPGWSKSTSCFGHATLISEHSALAGSLTMVESDHMGAAASGVANAP
eukprot:CAMPEP_0174729358 /NCGR_PEP_ID=MMETSP1094-20130205/53554_1 /TAXON_ID=156173 /ORGANISM="Chrysochromulina brevifilum, Strain UTEX LB 985" /LENGTH=99 /DNA_ID=CAMNT_0015931457 /DNA_START=142 /DNA_END=438 /DNA_ORIENTATION=-